MIPTNAYAAPSVGAALVPFSIERRHPGPSEVLVEILYCGICHTDIHFVRGEYGAPVFPAVPGHEIVGRVIETGTAVTKHEIGDVVGIGCMIDSCRHCAECDAGHEQFCKSMVGTYAGIYEGKPTFGGYSSHITADESYVLSIPTSLSPTGAAPLLCAGITMYSPLCHWRIGTGSKVGVVGLGGLGHLAVQLAVAKGADVTVFSTSESKRADAMRLGAKEFVISKHTEAFARLADTFDLILSTVSVGIDCDAYISTLKRDGTLVLVGLPDGPLSINAFGLLLGRRSVSASMIGGIRETQEMLDFCAQHGIESDVEVIAMSDVNDAYARVLKGDVRYRFVIDMATLKQLRSDGA